LANSTLLINPGAGVTVSLEHNWILKNDGTVTWATGTINVTADYTGSNTNVITNNGTFDIQGDLNLTTTNTGEAYLFTNNGTLKKSNDPGTASLAMAIVNNGTVTVTSGTLQFINQTFP
jgi:hypothetical protein